MTTATQSYTRTQQALHWLSALLILAMFPLGFIMARTGSDELRTGMYAAHAAIGMIIAVIAVVRFVLARRRPVAAPPGMLRWNEVLHRSVHVAALVVPVLLAMTGIGTLALNGLIPALFQGGAQVPAELVAVPPQAGHRVLAWAYIALLITHVVGVMRYQFSKGDVMRRMGARGFPGRTA